MRWAITDLGALAGGDSGADAINERGQVAGNATTGAKDSSLDSVRHVFLWQNGKMRDLGNLGGWWSGPVGINDRGQIVATVSGGGTHAEARWVIADLGTLGGSWGEAVLPHIPPAALADLFRLVATPEGGQEFYRVQQLRNALQRVLEGASPGDAVESTVTLTG